MSNKICKCGHDESEHQEMSNFIKDLACFHPNNEIGLMFCECMNFEEDLQAHLKQIEANYDALQTPMPCGHLARYAVNGEEGTQYCVMCVLEAKNQEIESMQQTIDDLQEYM